MERTEELEDQCYELEQQLEDLREEINQCKDPRVLVAAIKEYLEWSDDPNPTMNRDAQADITRQLRWTVNDALKEMEA